ncbi:cell division protein FtsQ/DivIB [Myxosarcina sp. GI1]|uniref:cell division protein FtsQ/DivIB n=1 Tax=Myxosarcina sp. GI1 TaxID=1541065 RepID=UPI000562AE3E|nr:FtsQ-type POTRA domain-containing protein [Myxosarcina sp. GI1]
MVKSLSSKLEHLRRKQQRERRRSLWRAIVTIGGAIAITGVGTSSYWQIKGDTQVQIEGENLVSEAAIHALLDLKYPQFLGATPSQKLAQKLESIPAIATVRVSKQTIPPKLTIFIRERVPVALALSAGKVGFLDAEGTWIPSYLYKDLKTNFSLPQLKVINFPLQSRASWTELYRLISAYSAVEITEVRWDESEGLFLKTELGMVYLGSDMSQLEDRFKVMVRLKNLPERFDSSKIAFIDLSNPQQNLIQKYRN